ncbi:mitochondrial carrier [Auriculariales sp. MPI-PUGE-AT-0066]|nr:mitochondrial carrier [Auriculariales sp. MPI-PUGE-AT-0066]
MSSSSPPRPGGDSHVRIVGAFAGVGSGLAKVTVGHGFDTIKTRMQVSPPGTYHGAMDCLIRTVRHEGVLGLYKGVTPPAVGWSAIDSILLGSLHNYRLFLMRCGITEAAPLARRQAIAADADPKRLTLFGHWLAGLMAGVTSAIVATPIEMLKVRLMMQRQRAKQDRQFKGPVDCAKQVYSAHGVQGLWRGYVASTLFRTSFCWMFGSIEVMTRQFSKLEGTKFQMSPGTINFVAGGLSGFPFWFFAMPLDNLKNRIMTEQLGTPTSRFFPLMRAVVREEGVRGLYKGFWPAILRAGPVNASAYFVFTFIMDTFGAENVRGQS